ncbi:MAG: hypothetical protein KJO79_07590, partial [Verrucomicrobiae bacterium]|nr:hypothetical protein [Verrucomicrobiae bacterium]
MYVISVKHRLGVLLGCLSLFLSVSLSAQQLKLLKKTTVERKALTFADGAATRFGNVVNGRSHQQSPLTTYRGYQYATYFDAKRRVC